MRKKSLKYILIKRKVRILSSAKFMASKISSIDSRYSGIREMGSDDVVSAVCVQRNR